MSPQRPKHRIFTRLKTQDPPTGQRHNVLRLGLTSVWNMLIHWLWKYQPYITLPHAPGHIIYIYMNLQEQLRQSLGSWHKIEVLFIMRGSRCVLQPRFQPSVYQRRGGKTRPSGSWWQRPDFRLHLSRGTLTVSPKASVMKELGLSQTAFWSLPVLTWCNHCRNDSRSWKIAFNLMTVYYGYVDGSSFLLILNWKWMPCWWMQSVYIPLPSDYILT